MSKLFHLLVHLIVCVDQVLQKIFKNSSMLWISTHVFIRFAQMSHQADSVFSDFCQESGLEMCTENRKAGDDFIVTLFNLFSCLNNVPKALTQALQPYLERAHIWKHLYTLAGNVSLTSIFFLWSLLQNVKKRHHTHMHKINKIKW